MEIVFIKHSTYLVDTGSLYLLFDYYGDPSLSELSSTLLLHDDRPLICCTTHSHEDHYTPEIFDLSGIHPGEVSFVCHKELQRRIQQDAPGADPLYLATGEECRLQGVSIRAYGSTDLGGSFGLSLPREGEEPWQIFYAGDLNNWHWREEADAEHVAAYEDAYAVELQRVVRGVSRLDLLFFPTDLRLGPDYLRGLEQFVEQIPTRYLAPMHLNGTMTDRSPLTTLCERYEIQLLFPENTYTTYTIS